MDNLDKYFKGQQQNEEYVCFFRHHWVVMIKEFLYFAVFLIIAILGFIYLDQIMEAMQGTVELKLFFLTGFMIMTFFMHRFFLKMLNYFVNIGIITSMRVIDHQKTLFFKDSFDSIDMAQIQNIERISNGVLPNLLSFGDIRIFLNASDSIHSFRAIPNAKFIFRCISRQKEQRQNQLREILHERENKELQEISEMRHIPLESLEYDD